MYEHEAYKGVYDAFWPHSHEAVVSVRHEFERTAEEMRQPFVLLRPQLFADGNMWCALYGKDIQEGVSAFGETPEKAAIAFNLAWMNQRARP